MFIDDEAALRDWLVTTLEPLCDAEPIALARYVLALIAKDKPLDKLRENCIDRLDVFLDRSTKDFVDQLFDVIRDRRYIPEGKKENVQPTETQSPESQQEDSTNATASTTTKRRYSSRQTDPSENSPTSKRTHRSYSRSSSPESPTSDQPNTTTNSTTKIPCKDFFDNKGYCALGDTCPYDHGSNIVTYEQPNYYPSYQPYNPETPDLTRNAYPRQPLPSGQRTLVTVVTNAEPLPLGHRLKQNDSSGGPIGRTRRHVTTTPYPNDRRPQNRKRPWQKPDGSNSNSTTLEIRKIPVESNTISKLNEHFSKFGTVTNVQIAFDGSTDSALVAYSSFQEAETAYKNPEPLFNNRFIKIFWHNSNKTMDKNSTDAPPPPTKKPIKHQWKKSESKPSESVVVPSRPIKKKPAAPSSIKKEAAKKAAIEIRRKKHDLLEEQIQQQKLLLKKLETAETNEEKESIRSLMKQVDATIVKLKDSLRTMPMKSTPPSPPPKLSQQDLLKQRAEKLKKELETLRAKTSADMRRAMSTTIESKLPSSSVNQVEDDEENRLLTDSDQNPVQQYELETQEEEQLLDDS